MSAFAYPHGYSSAMVRREVRQAGWTSATAVENAFSPAVGDPPHIARLMVGADTPLGPFRRWTEGEGAPVAPLREPLRSRGRRMYRHLRAALGKPVGGPPAS